MCFTRLPPTTAEHSFDRLFGLHFPSQPSVRAPAQEQAWYKQKLSSGLKIDHKYFGEKHSVTCLLFCIDCRGNLFSPIQRIRQALSTAAPECCVFGGHRSTSHNGRNSFVVLGPEA